MRQSNKISLDYILTYRLKTNHKLRVMNEYFILPNVATNMERNKYI